MANRLGRPDGVIAFDPSSFPERGEQRRQARRHQAFAIKRARRSAWRCLTSGWRISDHSLREDDVNSLKWLLLSLIGVVFGLGAGWSQSDATPDAIRTHIEYLRQSGALTISNAKIASTRVLPAFYEQRQFRPAWTDPTAADDLLRAIQDSEQDGLDPADYHLATLDRLRAERLPETGLHGERAADLDLLQTDALIRLGYHLLVGKVDPERLDSNWNMSYEISHLDPVAMLQTMIDSGNVYRAIEQLKPQHRYYTRLKAALAAYRDIQRQGGWRPIPLGGLLQRGMSDARAPLLRQRLAITGDLPGTLDTSSTVFDDALEAVVKRFQQRHRLAEDGVVGPDTLAALNAPAAQRIDQLRVNLERGRWVLRDLPETFVVVNIADFKVYLIRDGVRVWDTLAVVGSDFHKTPVFTAKMTYLVFNPTWTTPRSIALKEMLPKVKRDRTYLQGQSIDVIDRAGNVVDQRRLNWAQYNRNYFPYTLRQRPGANNALGQVKFIFPNPHSVFLHDTPSKELFSKVRRDFSHGCIRVQNPLQFAKALLNDATKWNAATIQEIVASGKTQTVFLSQPIPVLVLYWTAQVDGDGVVSFIPDIYNRDDAVLKRLEEDFRIRQRDISPDSR